MAKIIQKWSNEIRWAAGTLFFVGVAWATLGGRVTALEVYRIEHTAFANRTLPDVLGRIEHTGQKLADGMDKSATDRALIREDVSAIRIVQSRMDEKLNWLVESRKAEVHGKGDGGAVVGMPPAPE